ncbi:hypothetical protein C5167_036065 [Papaver somniferum]|nr:hypothetical protein C5167_036065 [Papaver somniferum]
MAGNQNYPVAMSTKRSCSSKPGRAYGKLLALES